MEVGLIRYAPAPIRLIRERVWSRDGTEEVHAPLGVLGRAVVHAEEPEGDLHVRDPGPCIAVERSAGGDAVGGQVGYVEPVEGGAGRADLGGVVDEGLEGDVVWGYLELEVRLRVVGAVVLVSVVSSLPI